MTIADLSDAPVQEDGITLEWPEADHGRIRDVVSRSNWRITGKYPSWKLGRTTQWESQIERDAHILLDADADVIRFQEQPVRIRYQMDGKAQSHIPDLMIMKHERPILCEIKPNDARQDAEFQRRTEAMKRWLRPHGYEYTVMYEDDIRQGERLKNARFLLRYGRQDLSEQRREWMRRQFKACGGAMSWASVRSRGMKDPVFLSALCRCVLEGSLKLDLAAPWDVDTRVTWSARLS